MINYRQKLLAKLKGLAYDAFIVAPEPEEPEAPVDEDGYSNDDETSVMSNADHLYALEQFIEYQRKIVELAGIFIDASERRKIEECLRGFLTQKADLDEFNKLVEKIFN